MTHNGSGPTGGGDRADRARKSDQLGSEIGFENNGSAGAAQGPDQTETGSKKVPEGQTETGSKKVRGRAKSSLTLIEAIHRIAEAAQPITGRGVGYKLFAIRLIKSMGRADMQRVYRLLKEERERGEIPWEWIVDETRDLECTASWSDPEEFASEMTNAYRREFWNEQPVRCEVWSEKGTVRGVLKPVLDKYGVGFRVMHGFSSATSVNHIAQSDDDRPLIALYVGDFDPSGMFMSEEDLPKRLAEYGGHHVELKRIALTGAQVLDLPSFPASDKRKDPRFKWFTGRHGDQCWELDAMDPNDLRDCVEEAIEELIEPEAWERRERVNAAEKNNLREFLEKWNSLEKFESFRRDWLADTEAAE
jgi:hypothetical protein